MTRRIEVKTVLSIVAVVFAGMAAPGEAQAQQVTSDRILHAQAEPQNWLTHNGDYNSQHYSLLNQIRPENVAQLESKWGVQDEVFGAWQTSPIVVDGIMYITERPNDVEAVDARTGRIF